MLTLPPLYGIWDNLLSLSEVNMRVTLHSSGHAMNAPKLSHLVKAGRGCS